MNLIGGEMELNLDLLKPATDNNSWLFQYDFTTSGRSGIKLALQSLNTRKPFLLPSFLCDSIIQPFKELSIPFRFYRINEDLSIDISYIAHCKENYDLGGIFIINYFGRTYNEETISFLKEIKKDIWIIEDYTHGSLVETRDSITKSIGHIVISSLRKYLPLPDGCIVINNSSQPFPVIADGSSDFSRIRTIAKLLRWEFINNKLGLGFKDTEALFLKLFSHAENNINECNPIEGMSYLSKIVLSALDLEDVKNRRKSNFLLSSQLLSTSSLLQNFIKPVFTSLTGASPFCFPVRIVNTDRDKLRADLAQRNLFCSILWPLPVDVDKVEFNSSYNLSKEILCIPIDQRYSQNDMVDIFKRLQGILEDKFE